MVGSSLDFSISSPGSFPERRITKSAAGAHMIAKLRRYQSSLNRYRLLMVLDALV